MNLEGRFHAHITYESCSAETPLPAGWKTTIILLAKEGRQQTDVMLTRHFLLGSNKNPDMQSIFDNMLSAEMGLEMMGHSITRVKLEHESLPTLPVTESNYRECHVKIRKPVGYNLETVDGYVESRNPMEVCDLNSIVFLNARYYSGLVEDIDKEIDESVNCLRVLNPLVEILEVKKESTVYDTNNNLDRWWA